MSQGLSGYYFGAALPADHPLHQPLRGQRFTGVSQLSRRGGMDFTRHKGIAHELPDMAGVEDWE
ncbi:hypothetical protein LG290_15820 [Halomonas sediminis]